VNTVISPWGIAHALSMVFEGALQGSASEQELGQSLFGAKSEKDEVRTQVCRIASDITRSDTMFSDANSAWINPEFQVLERYVNTLKEKYAACVFPLEDAQTVNCWVSEATHNKITSIVDQNSVSNTLLLLINAIYFKGMWQVPFDKSMTTMLPFYTLNGTACQVPLMYLCHKDKSNAVQAAQFDVSVSVPPMDCATGHCLPVKCTAVKFMYQGGQFSAIASMPAEVEPGGTRTPALPGGIPYEHGLMACGEAVLNRLASTADESFDWLTVSGRTLSAIKVFLPRFEIEYSTSLNVPLTDVGIRSIFRPGDLTNIIAEPSLCVSDIIHKVYVKVDEEGTEAAAVTAVMMVKSISMMAPPEIFVKFDRPFNFTIVHEPLGLALFSGIIHNVT
jgi:serpin B